MRNLYVLRIQTALFLSALDFTQKLNLALAIQTASNDILSGEPILLPTPPNAPGNIPVLIMQQENKMHVCQVAPGRVDVVCQQRLEQVANQSLSLKALAEQHIQLTTNIWLGMQAGFKASAYRIGFVTRQITFEPDAQNLLQATLLKNQNLVPASELQIHALHKLDLASYHINRWVRLMNAPPPESIEAGSMLQIEVDINTLPEIHLDLSAEDVGVFSHKALQLTEETVRQFLQL